MFTKLKREHTCLCGNRTDYHFRVTSSREDFEEIQKRLEHPLRVSHDRIVWRRQCPHCGVKDNVELVVLLK